MKTFIVILCLFVIASDGCFFKRGHNKRKETIFDVMDKVFSKPKEPVCESVLPIIKNKIKEKNRDIVRLEDQLKVKDEKLKICTERNRNWENKQNKRAVGKQEVEKLNMKIKELSNQLKKQSQAYELLLLEKQNTIDYLLQITQEMEESQMELTELYNVIEEYKKEKRKDSLTISSLNAIIKLQRAILRKSAQPQPQSIVSSDVPKQLEDCKSNLTDITERERTKDNQIKELNEALTLSQNSEEQLKNTLSEMEQQFQEKESGWVDDIKTLEKKLNIAENRLNEKEEKLQHLVSKVQKKCQAEVNRITAENAELQSKIEELMDKDKDNSKKSEEPNNHQYKSYPNKRISHQTRVAHGFKDEDECRLVCNDNVRCKAFYVDTIAGICYTTEKPIKESIVDSLRSSMSFNLFEQNVWIKLEDTNQV